MNMPFTFDAYIELIGEIQRGGYIITDYHKCHDMEH